MLTIASFPWSVAYLIDFIRDVAQHNLQVKVHVS